MNKYSFDELDNMSAEELERIVDEDAQRSVKEQLDDDTMLYILKLLEEKGSYDEAPDTEEAYLSFLEDYLDIGEKEEKKQAAPKRKWGISILKTACIAAVTTVILFMGTVTAAAAGFDPYEEVARWTEKHFELPKDGNFVSIQPSTACDEVAYSLESIQQFLMRYGISSDVIPSYLPEGYSFRDYNGLFSDFLYSLVTVGNGSDTIKLQYTVTSMIIDRVYAKDPGDAELYEAGGITHYIMTHNGSYKVIWRNGQVECAISGVKSHEELIKIINSIYE